MRYGLGWFISLTLVSCWAPLPPATVKAQILRIGGSPEFYEVLNLTYQLNSFVALQAVILKSALYENLEIHLSPILRQNPETRLFEGGEEGIRFSLFQERLPRGRYELILVGTAGQKQNLPFYLEGQAPKRQE